MSRIKTGEMRKCLSCGVQIYVPGWQISSGQGKYCSRQCHAEGRKGKMSGIGSSYRTSDGYIHVYYPSHPDASKSGLIMQHRLVAEEKYGRRLKSNEHVHHINGIKDDNSLENLELVEAGDHARITMSDAVRKRKDARTELATLRRKVAQYEKSYGPIP